MVAHPLLTTTPPIHPPIPPPTLLRAPLLLAMHTVVLGRSKAHSSGVGEGQGLAAAPAMAAAPTEGTAMATLHLAQGQEVEVDQEQVQVVQEEWEGGEEVQQGQALSAPLASLTPPPSLPTASTTSREVGLVQASGQELELLPQELPQVLLQEPAFQLQRPVTLLHSPPTPLLQQGLLLSQCLQRLVGLEVAATEAAEAVPVPLAFLSQVKQAQQQPTLLACIAMVIAVAVAVAAAALPLHLGLKHRSPAPQQRQLPVAAVQAAQELLQVAAPALLAAAGRAVMQEEECSSPTDPLLPCLPELLCLAAGVPLLRHLLLLPELLHQQLMLQRDSPLLEPAFAASCPPASEALHRLLVRPVVAAAATVGAAGCIQAVHQVQPAALPDPQPPATIGV